MESRAPWYARLVGWILLAFGALNVAGGVVSLVDRLPFRVSELAFYGVLAMLPLAGGLGVILSRRWGWIVSLLAIASWTTYGLMEYAREAAPFPEAGDIEPDPTTLVLLVLPALAMLGALLAPATIRWLRAPARAA